MSGPIRCPFRWFILPGLVVLLLPGSRFQAAEADTPATAPAVATVPATPKATDPDSSVVRTAGSLVPGLDPTAPALTIEQALQLSSVNNMQREIAEARLQNVLALEQQAYSQLYPTLTASGGYSTVSSSDRPFGVGPAQTVSGQAQVSLNVFNAAAFPGVTAAKKNTQAQRYSSRELERTLAFTVARSFLIIIANEQVLDAAARRLDVAKHSVSDAKARAGAGLSSQNDATRARLTQATAELAVTSDAQAVSTARLALAQLIGSPVVGPLVTSADTEIPGRDEPTLELLALRQREDLISLRLQAEAQRKLAFSERLGIVPVVSVVGSYADRNVSGNASLSAGILPAGDPVWTVGINATWTLYDGGLRSGHAAAFDATARELYAQYRDQRTILQRDLATAIVSLTSAEAAVVQAGIQVEVAQTNNREVQARSQQGLSTALDVADAIASLFEAEAAQVQRTFDLQTNRLQLRSLVGMWPTSAAALPGTVSPK